MFTVSQDNQIPLPPGLAPKGTTSSHTFEMGLALPVLICTFIFDEHGVGARVRTLFTVDPEQLQQPRFAFAGRSLLRGVTLLRPAHVDGATTWRLDRIKMVRALYTADDAVSYAFLTEAGEEIRESEGESPSRGEVVFEDSSL
jgi:hypothetical protein